jgi:ABC-type Mn2+/Zn2+ transport system permease subunit
MDWLLEPFRHEFMQRALLGSALIGFTNGFLSAFIVIRRLALMADALSHSLLPGLALGVILFGLAPVGLFFGALVAAMLVALGAELISRSSRVKEDTSLGILYTVAFSCGLVLLTLSKVRVDLRHYLFGNVLGLSDGDLWTIYGISCVSLLTLVAVQRPLLVMLFEPAVARTQGVPVAALSYLTLSLLVLAMISSLQAVGVILALGLLTAPAATIYLFSNSFSLMFWGGGFLGMLGSCIGLYLSYWFDLPSGPSIVLVLGGIFFLSFLFSPKYGVLHPMVRRRHFHEESLARWTARDKSRNGSTDSRE